MDIKALDKEYIAGTYSRYPVSIVSGKGSLAWDENGKEYIDLGTGIGTASFGFCDEAWVNAVEKQLHTFQHTSNLYYTSPCVLLAKMLCEKTGMKKVFFGNSGAEANECAIKAARKFMAEKKGPDCYTIVTLKNSFHGRTLTTLAATGQGHYHELFLPLTPGFISVEAENMEELEKLAETAPIAAVMIECIRGEGGVLPLSKEYASALQSFVKDKDILLIVDEVQTGNGRTGRLYSYMNYGLEPDIVSTAKGLAGGLPMGACLLSEKLQNVFGPGDHGSTFGGNPVSSAGALSILSRIDDGLLAEVREKGEYIRSALSGAPGVKSISGMGLMVGILSEKPASEVVTKAMDLGVLCLTAKDRVRLLPALNIPKEVLEKGIELLKEALKD